MTRVRGRSLSITVYGVKLELKGRVHVPPLFFFFSPFPFCLRKLLRQTQAAIQLVAALEQKAKHQTAKLATNKEKLETAKATVSYAISKKSAEETSS